MVRLSPSMRQLVATSVAAGQSFDCEWLFGLWLEVFVGTAFEFLGHSGANLNFKSRQNQPDQTNDFLNKNRNNAGQMLGS